jgi:DnaK suppressor protein
VQLDLVEGVIMEAVEAKELLRAERKRVQTLLGEAVGDGEDDRATANEPGDMTDSAEPLTTEQTDDALAASLRERLEAIERAEARVEAGTFGRSLRSGLAIPDERLRADPTAELTVEEASQPADAGL